MRIHNTQSRTVEEFQPLTAGKAGLYTCGPTVYNYAHIGNLRTYIFEDVLKRVLQTNSLAVTHVMNITDVGHLTSDADTGDDKMEKGARREGKTVWEIAAYYTAAFQKDMEALNCLPPDIWCKATDHIEEQINLVKRLEEKGFTYRIGDGIYFDTARFARYAEFARLDLEKQKAGARVALADGKRNSCDFALWKFSPVGKVRQMEWDSPWGKGFPGWHIECSAMAMKYLGETFDLHCGGIDHIPVHHTNEIAQAEAATDKPFVRYWVHGEFLVMDKAKMAKSGENFITLESLREKGYETLDYRYFCFTAHYRSPLAFSWEAMDGAHNALRGLRERAREYRTAAAPQTSPAGEAAVAQFNAQAADDLNIPNAMAVLWTALRNASLSPSEKLAFLEQADRILGLGLLEAKEESLDAEVEKLIRERNEARARKDYAKADEIRKRLAEMNILLEDTPAGTRGKRR